MAGISLFADVIMGRTRLAVSEIYGLIVSGFVQSLTKGWAILAGLLIGLALYVLNLGIVSAFWPSLRGNEGSVVFTHSVFGLIAAASYRGLLRREASPLPH